MARKKYVRKSWHLEDETAEAVRSTCESLLACLESIRTLEAQLTHSPGCIVMKGPGRCYAYWQYYENGVHIHKFVKGEALAQARQTIETFKALKDRLRNLRFNLHAIRCSLRHYRLDPDAVVAEYEQRRQAAEQKEAQRQAAMAAAQKGRYPDSRKHFTDRLEPVRSKSEMMIANELNRHHLRYDYEKPLDLPDGRVQPDFTLYLSDGTQVYWEHAGMMQDPRYAANFRAKLRSYELAGLYVNERLIVTYDDNGTVNLDSVRLFIRSKPFQKVKPDGDKDEAAGQPVPNQKPDGQG